MRHEEKLYRIKVIKDSLEKTTKGPFKAIGGGFSSLNPNEIQKHLDLGERGFEHVEYYGGALIAESMSKDNANFYAEAKKHIEFLLSICDEILDPKRIEAVK